MSLLKLMRLPMLVWLTAATVAALVLALAH